MPRRVVKEARLRAEGSLSQSPDGARGNACPSGAGRRRQPPEHGESPPLLGRQASPSEPTPMQPTLLSAAVPSAAVPSAPVPFAAVPFAAVRRIGATALVVAVSLAAPAAAQDELADTVRENTDRLDELEDLIFDVGERVDSGALWSAYTGENVTLGGHVTTAFSYLNGENGGATSGFSLHFLELYFKADLGDGFSVFATPGFFYLSDPNFVSAELFVDSPAPQGGPSLPPESNPGSDDDLVEPIMERAYGEWMVSDALRLRFGRIGSGHGVVAREYFVPSRAILAGPMLMRAFGAASLYPQKVEGIQMSGIRRAGEDIIEYEAYVGSDRFSPDDLGAGTRVGYTFSDSGLNVAANWGYNRRAGIDELTGAPGASLVAGPSVFSPFPYLSLNDNYYQFYGLDVDWRSEKWRVKAELYKSDEDGFDDRFGMYVQPTFYVSPKLALSFRADYFDAGQEQTVPSPVPGTASFDSLGHSKEVAMGVMYTPIPSVAFRLDVHQNYLPRYLGNDEITFVIASASFSF